MTGKKQKRIAAVIVVCAAAAFALWFWWSSYSTARERFVGERVRQTLETSLTGVVYQEPRDSVSVNGGDPFYAANLTDLQVAIEQRQRVYDALLEELQSEDLPACKVVALTLVPEEYDSSTVGVSSVATVRFELAPGLYREISVQEKVPSPKFRSATGDAVQ